MARTLWCPRTRPVSRWVGVVLAVTSVVPVPIATRGDAGRDATLERLKREIEQLRKDRDEQEKRLKHLERQLRRLQHGKDESPNQPSAASPAQALDRALESRTSEVETTPPSPPPLWAGNIAGAPLRLLDLSLDTMVAAGASTATDRELEGRLQAGGHDPIRRGFTLQQAELSLMGAVDPYLTGEAHILFSSHGAELEEAFMTTTSLPHGLQMEAGLMLTEYGLINPLHPHAWDWIDQPVIISRLLGPEGLRSPGIRVGWLTPLPWFSEFHVGAQNANEGEFTPSFLATDAVGGRPGLRTSTRSLADLLYLGRWENFWSLTSTTGLKVGTNLLHGPNSTGADGETWIYGVDLKVRWRPESNFRGWPFFLWQTEVHKRDYTAAFYLPPEEGGLIENALAAGLWPRDAETPEDGASEIPAEPIGRAILRDVGFYSQALYGFRYGWAAGLRLEFASGKGASVGGRPNYPLRSDRLRLSPLLVWHPTEYSRLRLQYNYDRAQFLPERNAHTVWLSAEILYGRHPAHKY
ncbi:MAG: hypothetical protein KatS3mg077_0692 [Candidatus Binatia bacterium]|nr:MAG: hypothetical protein KatS3mg077_0692 [Candidatus Binatia bacterium]